MYLHGLGGHQGDHLHDGLIGAALPKCPQALCYGASCGHVHSNVLQATTCRPLKKSHWR